MSPKLMESEFVFCTV
ncbi:hypothetical protein, partial [Vibrio parahaemolyticus]